VPGYAAQAVAAGHRAAVVRGRADAVAVARETIELAYLAALQVLPSQRSEWLAPEPTADERELLAWFIDAHERCDAAAAAAAASQDIRVTMPPQLMVLDGLDAIAPLLERAFGNEREGDWRLLPTSANRMPTAASYLLRPGDTLFRAFKFDVLRVEDGKIAEITTFGPSLFGAFDLPETLPG
jgi:RNA polymerase sigma-70 factor (ECF subfamily)